MNRIAFSLFGFDIYWYGVIICVGFLLGSWYIQRRVNEFGYTVDNLLDCVLICIPSATVCARLYFVVFKWDYYKEHLSEIISTRSGGLAIYGGVIGAFVALWIYSRRKKLSFYGMCDLAAMGLLIGQSIGRWGNLVNAEAYGEVTTLPWGMSIDGGMPVHPTFLYESVWNLLGFVLIHFYSKKRRFSGEIALLYIAWYGLGRAWIEGMRTDSLYLGPVRISQLLAAISCIAAVLLLARKYGRIKAAKAFEAPNMQTEEPARAMPEVSAGHTAKAEAEEQTTDEIREESKWAE